MKIETDLTAEELLRRGELAEGFAAMMDGRTREAKALKERGKAMIAASFDKRFGPVPAEIAAMTDDDLLAELLA